VFAFSSVDSFFIFSAAFRAISSSAIFVLSMSNFHGLGVSHECLFGLHFLSNFSYRDWILHHHETKPLLHFTLDGRARTFFQLAFSIPPQFALSTPNQICPEHETTASRTSSNDVACLVLDGRWPLQRKAAPGRTESRQNLFVRRDL
jgi:hypothetical protein